MPLPLNILIPLQVAENALLFGAAIAVGLFFAYRCGLGALMLPVVTNIHVRLGVVLARVTYKAAGSGSTAIRRRRLQGRARTSCRRVAAADAPVQARHMEA